LPHANAEQADQVRQRLAALRADLPKWQQAQSGNNWASIRKFLAENPESPFAAEAQRRLQAIKNEVDDPGAMFGICGIFLGGFVLFGAFWSMYQGHYPLPKSSGDLLEEIVAFIFFLSMLVGGVYLLYRSWSRQPSQKP
jgi:hypothetical protein